jgi:hypothetical protein
MALRKIHETRVGPSCAVRIYRDPEYGEYVVKTIVGGKTVGGKGGGAFESDKAAARGTAAAQVRWLKKRPACRTTLGRRRRRK